MAQGYARLFRRIWNDEKFTQLKATEKLVTLNILTSQSNRVGLFPFSLELCAAQCEISPQACRNSFSRVLEVLGWQYDRAARVLLVPSWWRWNDPKSFDTMKGYIKDLDDVPMTTLYEEFYRLSLGVYPDLPLAPPRPPPVPSLSRNQALAVTEPPSWGASRFEEAWKAYPHFGTRSAKPPSRKAFESLHPKTQEHFETIMAGMARCRDSEDWLREGGRFVPSMESWLRKGGWDASSGANGADPFAEFLKGTSNDT